MKRIEITMLLYTIVINSQIHKNNSSHPHPQHLLQHYQLVNESYSNESYSNVLSNETIPQFNTTYQNANFLGYYIFAATTVIFIVHGTLYFLMETVFKIENYKQFLIGSLLVFLISTHTFSIHLIKEKHGTVPFDIPTSVFVSEVVKFITILIFSDLRDLQGISLKSIISILFPASIFTLQNNIIYFTLSHIDPVTFFNLNTLKIVFTGICSYMFLKKNLNIFQWFSLIFLCIGIATSALCKNGSHYDTIGIISAIFSQVLSSIALVSNECILKDKNLSFYSTNLIMYMFGILLNFPFFKYKAFIKFDIVVWEISVLLSLIGLCTAVTLKYSGATTKNIISSGSIVSSMVFTSLYNKEFFKIQEILGCLIIIFSSFQYFIQLEKNTPTTSEEVRVLTSDK